MSEASTSNGKRRAHAEPDGSESKSKKPQISDHEQQGSNTATMEGLPTKPEPGDVLRMDTTLTPIFNHLNVIDLLAAYNVDKKFRTIVEDVIGQKKIPFDELRGRVSTAKVFKLLGEHMTNLQISQHDVANYPANAEYTDFDKFIKIITFYCSPGKLVELNMRFRSLMFSRHTESLLQQARPFFVNVAKLILHAINDNGTEVQQFLRMFPTNNRQTLGMNRQISNGNRINSPELQRLQHLYLQYHVDVSVDFTRFLELHPNLKSFYCLDNIPIESIARCVPNIENIGSLGYISREQINFFGRFTRLKRLEVSVQDGLFEILENLPNKHLLEVLALFSGNYDYSNEAVVRRLSTIVGQFTNLKWLKLSFLPSSAEMFLSIILPKLNAVTKCTLNTLDDPLHVQVSRLLKNLRVLFVFEPIGPELYQGLMDAWKKRQQEESFSHPIVISIRYYYERSMNDCQSVYDGNVVRFEENSDDIEFGSEIHL